MTILAAVNPTYGDRRCVDRVWFGQSKVTSISVYPERSFYLDR
ncbi:hypothetical protein [Leptolyngbya sp. FACHB-321]|nr:hypothetical protein [Leptolyngbya sp. FACHB-321]